MASAGKVRGPRFVIDLIQERNSTIQGVVFSPTLTEGYPRGELSSLQLPAVLTFPGEGIWEQTTLNQIARHERIYIMKVIVGRPGQGLGTELLGKACDLMAYIGAFWNDAENHRLFSAKQDYPEVALRTYPISQGGLGSLQDGGFDNLVEYNGAFYPGVEFSITVYEKT